MRQMYCEHFFCVALCVVFCFSLFLFHVPMCNSYIWSQPDGSLRLGQFVCRSIHICILKLFVTYKLWTMVLYTDSKSAVLCILTWLVFIVILSISMLYVRYSTHTADIYFEYVWWKHIFLSSLWLFSIFILSLKLYLHAKDDIFFAKYRKGLFIPFKYMHPV